MHGHFTEMYNANIQRPHLTNVVEGLVKLLRRTTSGGRLEAWNFRSLLKTATIAHS